MTLWQTVRIVWPMLALAAALGACIPKSEHQAAMDQAQRQLQLAQATAAQQQARAAAAAEALGREIAVLQGQVHERDRVTAKVTTTAQSLREKLDQMTALNQQLSTELKRLGRDVDALVAEKGTLSGALLDAKERLEKLREAQEAAEKRAGLFRSLLLKFKTLIDGGDLAIVLRDGRMVLRLRNDVLFDSGRVALKDAGKDALKQMAAVLSTLKDRKLQVAGHTDDVPISTARFPSNWELSAARALAVVAYLTEQGVSEAVLSAAGYSKHDPVASNDTEEGQSKNRRIDIVLQPDLSELVAIPDVAPASH